MSDQLSLKKEFTKGIIRENPVLRLVLGTCPTLATTTSVQSAFGMGIAAAIVLVCSNVVISALRKLIPDKVRIPAYIVIIATFVSIVQMFVKAYFPVIDKQLGIYLPLIVVNCIILGRAEAFAGKNRVLASAIDGLGMGLGFLAALLCMGLMREVLGAGTILGQNILFGGLKPIAVMGMAPGGFFAYGMLMALANRIAEKKGKPRADLHCCGCPLNTTCSATGGCGVEALAPKPIAPAKPKPAVTPASTASATTAAAAQTASPATAQTASATAAQTASAATVPLPAMPQNPATEARPTTETATVATDTAAPVLPTTTENKEA